MFKVVASSSHDIEEIWSSNKSNSIHKSEIINVDKSGKIYKSQRLTYWESILKPKEVREQNKLIIANYSLKLM